MGKYANKLWEEARDIQNVFFKFINSLISGYKELKINRQKQVEFRDDMQKKTPGLNNIAEKSQVSNINENPLVLELIDVEYVYKNTNDGFINLGPVNYRFKSGEITFITGGNGSGKSTLAKLLTGLYLPDRGKIILNNNKVSPDEFRNSIIF